MTTSDPALAPPGVLPGVLPGELLGPVRRSLLVEADGSRDLTSDVVWLQGPGRLFVDLRRPTVPTTSWPRSAADLADAGPVTLARLAAREGFAGRFTLDGELATWERLVDVHPGTGVPDEGLLRPDGDVLVETGVHAAYTEHWQPPRHPAPPSPAGACLLRDTDSGRLAVLVRVGNVFGLAVGRRTPLPPGAALADLLLDAAPQDRAGLLDTEVSLGTVRSGRRVVEASTLPWREQVDLGASTGLPPGRWVVVEREGDPTLREPVAAEAIRRNPDAAS